MQTQQLTIHPAFDKYIPGGNHRAHAIEIMGHILCNGFGNANRWHDGRHPALVASFIP